MGYCRGEKFTNEKKNVSCEIEVSAPFNCTPTGVNKVGTCIKLGHVL